MFILCINPYKIILSFHLRDRIGGVMVSVLALSAVDCGFDPQSGQAKDCYVGICRFFAKPQH